MSGTLYYFYPHIKTLIMIMPMLYVGMLLGGVKPIPGLITLLLLIAVSFVANMLSGSIALSMIRKGKK